MTRLKKIRGFTLIEVLIVVFLIVLVSRIIFSSFGSLNNRQALDAQIDLIQSTVQKARLESLNSKNGIAHGVTFSSTSIAIFDQGSATTRVTPYSNGIKLISHTLGTSSITFAKVTGLPSATGTLVFTLTNGNTVIASTTLSINGIGVIQ